MTEAALHTIAMTLTEWDFTVKGGEPGNRFVYRMTR